ncbi:MAG: hypothetical protein J7623_22095 [Chitinophaga sp.]|uniref:hypothetical protein n=1 Tax=Chitinophaga sp. TaxID=1869181 RepID=UPI001B01F41C|nr:hypothetical protein [Chitinophaga sp.]MBO9731347.1 hypothetical protein [Chitinophaga sp.]
MNKTKIFNLQGIKMPELTHQRMQELKLTPKGKLITATQMDAFPGLLKVMETALLEQLAQYDELRSSNADSTQRKLLLMNMLEDHLYWEFAYQVMFTKWREQKINLAS